MRLGPEERVRIDQVGIGDLGSNRVRGSRKKWKVGRSTEEARSGCRRSFYGYGED